MEAQTTPQPMQFTLVARSPNYGLPTACPVCLPVYAYLKLARFPFVFEIKSNYPDSDEIPYVDSGSYVAFNNETGGVIQRLKEDGILDLDSESSSFSEWVSLKAMVVTWLEDALTYELWIGSDGESAKKIYYSELPWVIGKFLFMKQVHSLRQRFGITKENAERLEKEIYQKAKTAYGALSTKLGEETYAFGERPSSLDAHLLAHLLMTLDALPESSVLRQCLSEFSNLVRYAENLRTQYLNETPSSPPDSSALPRRHERSKPKKKPKREKTAEEKAFNRKAKYFLITQIVSVLLYMSVMGGYGLADADDEDDSNYD